MTTMKLFDTSFENSMRVLLLLNQYQTPQTEDMLYAMDFIIVYGRTFGISDNDLNGENQYKFSEFTSRKIKVRNALKDLVLSGYVLPIQKSDSIVYQISDAGIQFCQNQSSEYAVEYSDTAAVAIEHFKGCSEKSIINTINKMSVKSIRKE